MNDKLLDIETAHAFCQDVLADRDATSIANAICSGELVPEEVVLASIARARAVEPNLQAIVTDCFDQAIDVARKLTPTASPNLPFYGVPTFIKDLCDVNGLTTRFGTEALAESKPRSSTDPYVQHLRDLGMIGLGKSSMPEFGFTPSGDLSMLRPTRNPWNLNRTAGGSSSGAGALVAAGVVAIAHAADGGGSTRIPAAACGLVGMKPTRRRLPPSAHTKRQIVNIVVDGVVTRTVRDTVRYYIAAEQRYHNRKLKRIGDNLQPINRSLKIGLITRHSAGSVDEVTLGELERTRELLEQLGHQVVAAELPVDPQFERDFLSYFCFLAFALTRAGRFLDPGFDLAKLTNYSQNLSKPFQREWLRFPGVVFRLRRASHRAAELFRGVDVLLSPTLGYVSPQIGHFSDEVEFDELLNRIKKWACFTPFSNAIGNPAISLPLGFDQDNNLPVGMMFAARHGEERLLLELALQLEDAAPFKTCQAIS